MTLIAVPPVGRISPRTVIADPARPIVLISPPAITAGTQPAAALRLIEPLSVTTVRQGARVAIHRTRRFTLLGEVPVVGPLVVPWLWPLHMAIVGLTAGHIRHTPDASLSYCDGNTPRRHHPTSALAVASFLVWLTALATIVLVLESRQMQAIAIAVLVVVVTPAMVELVGLIEFALLNPEWVTLKRERRNRTDERTTYVLTSLVARRDGHDFAGQLMDLTYPQWQAADAVVIGYPASKDLISYYVRMGARREHRQHAPDRPPRRRITFDCRQPLRGRSGPPGRDDQLRRSASPLT